MSSNPDEPWLIALGAVVSDGGHVDWTDAERRETTAEQRQLIDRLREVAAVVEAHRTAGASEAASTDRDSPAPPALPWRHLVLFERVGTGAFGSVHRAWDSLLDREVAVKLLPKSRPGAAAPLDEARNLARVRHSNVVVVHGADEDEHGAGIWMEFIEGETLATIVHERGPMGGREVAGIGLDLCGALSAIHAAGLLHRDIKAHNVMREVGGRIVLMDFSGAHAQSAGGAGVPLSGTPLYMAPELFDGVGATPASDVYSLGVLLFFLLTGILPVTGGTLEDVRKAHAQGQRKRLRDIRPDVADGLVQVVERAIEANPGLRFRTAGELERALAAASGAHVVVSPTVPGTDATHQAPRPRRRTWIWAAGIVAGASLAAAFVRWPESPASPSPPVRFTIGPPYVAGSWPRISPDGRQVVFGAIVEGRNRFWLRQLDQIRGRALMDTTANETPFWSPDSRTLCFFVDGKLRAIDIDGGSSRVLADAPYPHGGDWSGNTIVYARQEGLYRINRHGGTPERLTTVDSTQGEFQHGWPEFLPDGRRFLFVIRSERSDRAGIYVGSIDGDVPWRLAPAYSRPAYADRRLLYVRDGTLMAQPFDPDSASLLGEPAPVARRIKYHGSNDAAFDVSQSGVLVYSVTPGQPTTRLVLFDRRGRELQSLTEAGTFRHPRFSPDSQRVVAERIDPEENDADLWVYDIGRPGGKRLTRSPAQDITPVWSPDGRRVAFSSRRGPVFDIYEKTVDGAADEHVLLTAPGDTFVEHWSPDSRYITGTVLRSGLWLLPLDGEEAPRMLRSDEAADTWQSEFSPDNQWLAYTSAESGQSEAYVEPFPATGERWQVSSHGGGEPHWSSARELLYVDSDGLLHSVRRSGSTWRGAAPQPLFKVSIPDLGGRLDYALSPDGRFVVVNTFLADPVVPPIEVVVNWTATLPR